MIRQCSWCGKIMGERKPYKNKGITHGMCIECLREHYRTKKNGVLRNTSKDPEEGME